MNKSKVAKGDRLNWTPIKEVKPVSINVKSVKGERIEVKKSSSGNVRKPLVP